MTQSPIVQLPLIQQVQQPQNVNTMTRYETSPQYNNIFANTFSNLKMKYSNGVLPYDPSSQHVGTRTFLDEVHDSTMIGSNYSDNPMDPNWGGVEWTRKSVESGKYNDNLVVPLNVSHGLTTQSRSKTPLSVYA